MNLGESVSERKIFIDTVAFGFFLLFFRAGFFLSKYKQLAMLMMENFPIDNFSSPNSCNANFPCCND
jgi:hypothetical protein